jgi:hypothetical protein
MSGEIIRESAASFWKHPHWRLTVRDENGDTVSTWILQGPKEQTSLWLP